MCYCPTPTLHLNLALTGDGAFLFSLLCSPRLHLFDNKYSRNSEIFLYFYINVFCLNMFLHVIYYCDVKAEFSAAITPGSHDPSEIILICWFGD